MNYKCFRGILETIKLLANYLYKTGILDIIELCKQIIMCQVNKNASDAETSVLELRGMWSTLSLPLLPGPLGPGVVPVRDSCMDQIDLFKNYLY